MLFGWSTRGATLVLHALLALTEKPKQAKVGLRRGARKYIRKSVGSGSDSQPHCLIAVSLQISYIASLSLSFLLAQMKGVLISLVIFSSEIR